MPSLSADVKPKIALNDIDSSAGRFRIVNNGEHVPFVSALMLLNGLPALRLQELSAAVAKFHLYLAHSPDARWCFY